MLTESRIEKILELVKKEYDYMNNKPINIVDNCKDTWYVQITDYNYILNVNKNFDDYCFADFFFQYLAKEFGFNLIWTKFDYQNTINALALLHEIGHIQQTIEEVSIRDWLKEANIIYNRYDMLKMFRSKEEQMVSYRKIKYEYMADEFAIDMFNKYAIKILAILSGTTQKEIKNRLVEFNKEIA